MRSPLYKRDRRAFAGDVGVARRGMNVVPFRPTPRLLAMLQPFYVMVWRRLEQGTILRDSYGASGLGPSEQQSRNQERCSYGTAVRRQDKEDGDRGQNEQDSSCLENVPRTFARGSLMAESLRRGVIDAMGSRRSHKTPSISRSTSYQIRRFPYVGFMPSWERRGVLSGWLGTHKAEMSLPNPAGN